MELKNKKVNFLGDSITYGYGLKNPEVDRYTSIIERNCGIIARNYGLSGSTVALDTQHRDLPDFVTRQKDMNPDADIVVVFGGSNDYGHGTAPFGNPEDSDYTTFRGALNTLYKKHFTGFAKCCACGYYPTSQSC